MFDTVGRTSHYECAALSWVLLLIGCAVPHFPSLGWSEELALRLLAALFCHSMQALPRCADPAFNEFEAELGEELAQEKCPPSRERLPGLSIHAGFHFE
jgi:hypothetical protein